MEKCVLGEVVGRSQLQFLHPEFWMDARKVSLHGHVSVALRMVLLVLLMYLETYFLRTARWRLEFGALRRIHRERCLQKRGFLHALQLAV